MIRLDENSHHQMRIMESKGEIGNIITKISKTTISNKIGKEEHMKRQESNIKEVTNNKNMKQIIDKEVTLTTISFINNMKMSSF
jgi:hypothetical protein